MDAAIRKKKATPSSFKKGQSGNPTGRPKLPPDVKHVRELARQYTAQAIGALVEILSSDSAAGKVAAANALLDRGWGKAEQPITGMDGEAMKFEIVAPWLKQAIEVRNK